ncbi:MAG: hypothetical protein EBX46_06635, partial [Burkholderiaceae bacterium]|nr:hypothetical protein [Burkholderiaceae bacterium]
MAKSAKFCLLVYGALSVLSSHALAIDLQPNDIVAPTPDRTAISISYVNAQNTTLYVNNVPTGASPNLESNLGIVRLGHTYTIGSLPAVSYVQVGGGTLSPDGSLSAYPASQGMTDTTIATAIWPYANHTTRTYFGVAAYLSLPTGEYSTTKAFNLGSNRYSQALQLGYQRPITKSVDGAFAFDTVWYGANSQCAAACSSATNLQFTQKPLYSSQIGPIYRINQTYTVAAREALDEEMARDPRIFVMGEGIGKRGGNFNTTLGLYEKYGPLRLCDTPIAERGFIGLAVGAAMSGSIPVIDFMMVDFILDAMGEIINQMAKMQYMSSGRLRMPMVLRGCIGIGGAAATHHSGSYYSTFSN